MPGGAPRRMKVPRGQRLGPRLRVGGVEPSGGGPAEALTPAREEQSIFKVRARLIGDLWLGNRQADEAVVYFL